MSIDTSKLDEQISRLRDGNTLTETEVKALCEQVGSRQTSTLITKGGKSSDDCVRQKKLLIAVTLVSFSHPGPFYHFLVVQ